MIMGLFENKAEEEGISAKNGIFSGIKNNNTYQYNGSIQDYTCKRATFNALETVRPHHYF